VDEMVGALANAPGALPLLQFTAAMLWDARDRTRNVLTAASYEAIGGVGGALASHADRVLATMSPERKKLARAVFLRLVTAEGTRAIVDVAELTTLGSERAEVEALLDQLVAARLLVVQSREDGAAVEIVHESLLSRWPTLRRWLDESAEDAAFLEQLRTVAKQWDARGRAQGLLWRGEAMEDARTFIRRYKGELPARERSYVDAVLALATHATRRRRRFVIASFVVLGALLAAAAVAMIYIRDAERAAQQQRAVAEGETRRARDAEAKVSSQFQTIQRQLDAIKKAETERTRAEQERAAVEQSKAKVEQSLATAETVVAAKDEDLAKANKQLQRALGDARNETKRAEEASRALGTALAKEKAENKALQDKLSKLATKLR
jgi:eukaryotic-like serine/threonine-protein kinase